MIKHDDFLVEIFTEELPPKALLKLAEAFCQQIKERLEKAELSFNHIHFFATPRRLAVLVRDLAAMQPEQQIERKGPALAAAFNAAGEPSAACLGFARSCGVTPKELITIKSPQGEWVGFKQTVMGQTVAELLPTMIAQALQALPIAKRMRWGDQETQFVRPVHSVMMLYGAEVIAGVILGCESGRITRGHRFHAPLEIEIPHAADYENILATKGFVIADFFKRREKIQQQIVELSKKRAGQVYLQGDALLNEVTGLVEWPVALCGQFDAAFLRLPNEVLISAMQDHQRYFPVIDTQHKLLPYFITVSNIQSSDPTQILHGNERVLRARLADAAFFYAVDQKQKLAEQVARQKDIVFQAKLGTLYEKTERTSQIAVFVANKLGASAALAERAAYLAKADLTTSMVGEFPELQGVMGYYYALHDGEGEEVAIAIKEHYLPRFAGDVLPTHLISQVLAIADRIDTLVGAFGIHQIPTGDKDPYGLRRAALSLVRILIEAKINLDLQEVLAFAMQCYPATLENKQVTQDLLTFIEERLRSWYQDQGVSADVFAAVAALHITNPYDMSERIKAVQAFKKLQEADTLCMANKRVSNILLKHGALLVKQTIDPALFEHKAEQVLAEQLELQSAAVKRFYQAGSYADVLVELTKLRQPIDDFFDQVMVMTDDQPRRENRLLLLNKLRALFLQVADIALLQE